MDSLIKSFVDEIEKTFSNHLFHLFSERIKDISNFPSLHSKATIIIIGSDGAGKRSIFNVMASVLSDQKNEIPLFETEKPNPFQMIIS